MFYPVDSLKRGGRFYLCWVADSWPLRFAAITHRQLWQHDIRKLCDGLLEVMTNESGRPANRFSLRLSSQLMRGLVRLYEKKVTVLLGDLCMINANVFKTTNKKFVGHEVHARPLRPLPQPAATGQVTEEVETEQRVEELIQNSGNVVVNIQDITLKEAVIPDFQLPPNDGFGEEHPDQALQSLLADRTIEQMMQAAPGAQTSGLELDKSHETQDQSRHTAALHMEPVPELDVTLFGKATTEDVLPAFEKDISAFEIPEIPIPVPVCEPVPEPQIEEREQPMEEQPPELPKEAEVPQGPPEIQEQRVPEPPRQQIVEDIELEELEDQPQAKRRRVRPKLIIDKKIKLDSDFLRARVDNPTVELRCEDSTDDIVTIIIPVETLFRRPSSGGARLRPAVAPALLRRYQRNLGVSTNAPLADRQAAELNLELEQPRRRRTRSTLERIVEAEEPQPPTEPPVIQPAELDLTRRATMPPDELMNVTSEIPNITTDFPNLTIMPEVPDLMPEVPNLMSEVPNLMSEIPIDINVMQDPNAQMDLADLPTQKLETLSQVARKRTAEYESPRKRQKSMGHISSRGSRQQDLPNPEIIISEPDKENIPPNFHPSQPAQLGPVNVSTMLQQAGLADIQPMPVDTQVATQAVTQVDAQRRRRDSEGSETPLGSLDRTKVSLGDSVQTTDSQRFIRNQWGIEGTMMKIMVALKAGDPISVHSLVRKGPVMAGYRAIIAARCFSSVLKLKQHGFIRVEKDPDTLEIMNVTLGPRFDTM